MTNPMQPPSVEAVYSALDEVKDPCMQAAGLDLSIVDLGLVYDVSIEERCVEVAITFTEIGCIFTHTIGVKVYDTVSALPGVEHVEIVPRWLPIWTQDRLNDKASQALARQRVQMFENVKRRGLRQAAPRPGKPSSISDGSTCSSTTPAAGTPP